MPDISQSVPTHLPSSRTLVRATALALLVAGTLLVTVVLPAEFGIDPTGVGRLLGLQRMGEIKAALAAETAQADAAPTPAGPVVPVPSSPPAADPPGPRSETVTVLLQPGQGREIKFALRAGARLGYSWSTNGGVVNYDQHADSQEPRRDYHGYKKALGVTGDQGELVAAFDGWHGWFWRNRGTEPVTVTLEASGDYSERKEVK